MKGSLKMGVNVAAHTRHIFLGSAPPPGPTSHIACIKLHEGEKSCETKQLTGIGISDPSTCHVFITLLVLADHNWQK